MHSQKFIASISYFTNSDIHYRKISRTTNTRSQVNFLEGADQLELSDN